MKRTKETDIKFKRLMTALHFAKSEERLQFEEEHDCYLVMLCDGARKEVIIEGEKYYKIGKELEGIKKVSVTDPETAQIISTMKLRARFNGQRNIEVCGVWLPNFLAEDIKKQHCDVEDYILQLIVDNKFQI